MRRLVLIPLLLLACKSKGATNEPEDTIERAGHDVEEAAESVAEEMTEVGREAADALGEAAETAKEVGREAADAINETVDDVTDGG